MSKADWEKGIAIIRAFGRTDYMYVKEVAPPAYDSINDRIKVAIETSVPLSLEDDWARELGQVDIARILGAAPSATNPLPTILSDGSAYIDPRDRNWTITEEVPVSATDLDIRDLQKALDEVYGVLRTDAGAAYDARDRAWTLDDTDIPDLSSRAARELGIIYGDKGQLAQRTTSLDLYAALRYSGAEIDPRSIRALDYSTDDLLVYGDVGQLAQRAVSKDAYVQLRHEAAEIDPRSIRALVNTDIITAYLSKIGTTDLTPRDWSLDLRELSSDSEKGVLRSIGDAGATPANVSGLSGLAQLDKISREVRYLDAGSFFSTNEIYVANLANNSEADTGLLTNPNESGKTLVLKAININSDITANTIMCNVYASPTITSNGTECTPRNLHVGSSTASVAKLYRAPTIAARGTLLFGFRLAPSRWGLNEIDIEVDPNKSILINAINYTGVVASIGVHPMWYEK